ncbi:MAG: 3-hydroxyisobutyrate dehydrogenase [Acidiferrobacterales bacterium]|nr:3-hydroxyisobutyrate dehydrogenase [Acidiferrobacterales bacterium]
MKKTIETVAIIGTGNMGMPMAINLAKAGFQVRAFDIVLEKLTPLIEYGVIACCSHQDALESAELVLTMLPTGTEVSDVYQNHVIASASRDAVLIDSSTIDLKTAVEIHTLAIENGYRMLDAPVSGGTAGAQSGNLTFMVGGESESLQSVTQVLQAMAGKIVHCGKSGMGQAAKMCNNLMLGIQMVSVAEGFRLAQAVGLSEQTLYDVALNSSGNCAALTAFNPIAGLLPDTPASRDFQPGFSNDLMLKDMKLAIAAAKANSVPLDLAHRASALYQQFSEHGHGSMDFSAIFNLYDIDKDDCGK